MYEWSMTDAWDPSVPSHKDLVHRLVGNGIPELCTIASSLEALKTVGFEVLHQEDLAERDDAVNWFYPPEGTCERRRRCGTCSLVGGPAGAESGSLRPLFGSWKKDWTRSNRHA